MVLHKTEKADPGTISIAVTHKRGLSSLKLIPLIIHLATEHDGVKALTVSPLQCRESYLLPYYGRLGFAPNIPRTPGNQPVFRLLTPSAPPGLGAQSDHHDQGASGRVLCEDQPSKPLSCDLPRPGSAYSSAPMAAPSECKHARSRGGQASDPNTEGTVGKALYSIFRRRPSELGESGRGLMGLPPLRTYHRPPAEAVSL